MRKLLTKALRFLSWLVVLAAYYMATWSLAELIIEQTGENLIRLMFWGILSAGVLGLLCVRRRIDTNSWRLPVVIVVFLVIAVLNLVGVMGAHMAELKTEYENNSRDAAEQTPPEEVPKRSISAEEVIAGVNQQRIAAGLEPLTVNPLLSTSACLKTDDMIAKNYWGHDSPDGTEPWYWIKLAGYSYTAAGENLAYGYATSEAMVEGWMNSPTHRENILSTRYKETGVCIKRASRFQGAMDQLVATQHFGTR